MHGRIPLCVALALATAVGGCSKGDPQPPVVTYAATPTEATSASAATAPTLALPPAAAAVSVAPPTSGPRAVKEFLAVDAVSLGSLPPGIGIPPGGPAPGGAALSGQGERVDLGALRRTHGALLVVFSPGGFDPYSNFEIREIARANTALRQRGVTPVVITADRPGEAEKTKTTYDVPFLVLSDSDLVLHEAFRVVHRADAAELKSLARRGADIEAMSGRTHHGFAAPSLFLVGKDGTVLWSHASEDERLRPKISQVIAALDARSLPGQPPPR